MRKKILARNAKHFRNLLSDYTGKVLPGAIKRYQIDLTYYAFYNLLTLTPVDTSHARHNWYPSVNVPNMAEIPGRAGVAITGEVPTSTEKARFTEAAKELDRMELGQRFWLTNFVPYILPLEDGWSGKAPNGMAKVTLHAVIEYAKATPLKIK